MRRQMRFNALAWIDTGINRDRGHHGSNHGYIRLRLLVLVGMAIASALVSSLSTWDGASLGARSAEKEARILAMLRFGGDILTYQHRNYFARQADNLLMRWKVGGGTA
jgi:hypothetical protein